MDAMREVCYEEKFIKSTQGVPLLTCKWFPSSPMVKSLIFILHGYGMECSSYMKGVGTKLAREGYVVFGIDYEGHGRSKGDRCYIKNFESIVDDCEQYFMPICESEQYRGKGRFLYGESMGAAVVLYLHMREPTFWNGAVLVSPMCKLMKEMLPPRMVINILVKVEELLPKWKIVPTKDIIETGYKDPIKREELRNNKLLYQGKPRLKTAMEMARTTAYLGARLHKVTLPFIILHGEGDTVVDPAMSRVFYEQASSSDKTIKLYPDMWHSLIQGEPDDNVHIVFSDIISWLDTHVQSVPLENQGKTHNKDGSKSQERRRGLSLGNSEKDWSHMAREGHQHCNSL